MKLTDLNPSFVGAGGEGITRDGKPVPKREGVGLSFDCPCGCGEGAFIPFENPIDGGPPHGATPHWKRIGESFDSLTLEPSIQRVGGCEWHGWLRNGELTEA